MLAPGGVFLHVGVHPCFCGAFADRADPAATVIRPGYRERGYSRDSWTSQGVRDKVGAMHFPLAELLGAFVAAGLTADGFAEAAPRRRSPSQCGRADHSASPASLVTWSRASSTAPCRAPSSPCAASTTGGGCPRRNAMSPSV